ncbi:MAG: hypothetical protein ACFFD2_03660 [Promethearchaeota archaeon]
MGHLPPAPVRGRDHRTSPSGAKANIVQLYHVRIILVRKITECSPMNLAWSICRREHASSRFDDVPWEENSSVTVI